MKRLTLLLPLAVALGATGCNREVTCAADETVCGGTCASLQGDPFHCGACGNACATGQGCSAGACVDCTAPGAACTAAVVAACGNLNQVRLLASNLALAAAPIDTDELPISIARLGQTLYVANSLSSSLSAVTLSPPPATSGATAIPVPSPVGSADLENVAVLGSRLWVSDAAASTLVAIDPATGGVVDEIALAATAGDAVNPQGLAFVGTKGYLALGTTFTGGTSVNQLLVLDLSTVPGGRIVKRIDLQPLASPGAQASPSRVVAVGSKVYVTLNNARDTAFVRVAGANGRLAVVDATTDTLAAEAVDLGAGCVNPSGLVLEGTTLWVACGFVQLAPDFLSVASIDGASLTPVDAATGTPGAPVPLPNAATSVAFCGGRGYAGASDSGTVIAFDPTTRAISTADACPVAAGKLSQVPDLACPP